MTTLVVGVCGASSSGKTWLAAELSAGFAGRSEVISQDGYYRDNAAVQLLDYRHDNPEAIDFDALVADVEALLCNGHADVPVYDYTVHAVAGTRRLAAPELLIIEGHLLFASAALRALCGYTVWVSAKADLRLERRLRRDIEERGRDAADVEHRFLDEAEPAHNRYMRELQQVADDHFVNDGSPAAQTKLTQLIATVCAAATAAQSG